ncbi:hypothetical protein SmJEL517_g05282 [Synchytrium microbalum]|uniref:SnoaL-like domain-containing protein n=1 Tax=Synchytrium microbalum TaxID=1806994 RepID=A0A507BVX3_9FUNG|nr:uncharacterized protein SmJEL517_g05282 [Synchytrium microbalum]TPX31348.1 hypothetical protein SmJEL517_g05282 [Synchytrium microbalum]
MYRRAIPTAIPHNPTQLLNNIRRMPMSSQSPAETWKAHAAKIPNPQHFAEEWISAWNSRSIPQILSHYSDDIEYSSPLVERVVKTPDSRFRGMATLKAYVEAGLELNPDLHFTLRNVFTGAGVIVLEYENTRKQVVAEVFEFGEGEKVRRVTSTYREA